MSDGRSNSGFTLLCSRPAFAPPLSRPIAPSGQWKAELCDCCSAGGICCAACCCPFIVPPQLFQKVTGKAGSCKMYGMVLLIFWIAYNFLGQMSQSTPAVSRSTGEFNIMWAAIVGGQTACELVVLLIGTYLLMTVRKIIRTQDQIGTASCGESEDCCCSFWCSCCTAVQMFQHLNVRCENGYRLCTEEGIETPGNVPAV